MVFFFGAFLRNSIRNLNEIDYFVFNMCDCES